MKKLAALFLSVTLILSAMVIPVAATDTSQTNLALSATASAISEYSDNYYHLNASKLNDGNRNTSHSSTERWTTTEYRALTLADTPVWAQYTWENAVTFDTVDIYEWRDGKKKYRTNEFRLSVSDDGESFETIYTGYAIGEYKHISLDKAVTAKNLRITIYSVLDGISDIPCLNEIEVYNNASDATVKSFTVGAAEGIINDENATITVGVSEGTDVTAITPMVVVAPGASYTPAGAQDFTSPVIYTVTAKDGTTKRSYTVTLMKNPHITDAMLSDKGSSDVTAFGPTPSLYQYNYHKQELAAFLHFGMNTFTGEEWGNGEESPSQFTLDKSIDADGYVKTLKEAGFKKLIVTAKHHDGFCIWDSKYTEHDIAATNYPGDVLEDVSTACTKYGIEMGLYLSPWDRNAPSYGYYDAYGNQTDKEHDYLDYNDYYVNQLDEILSNPKYGCNGHFTEIWLDGAKGTGADAQEYDFVRFVQTMNKYEGKEAGYDDNPLLFGTDYGNVRWIGNELGVANEENWAKIIGRYESDTGFNYIVSNGTSVIYKGAKCGCGAKEGNVWAVPEVDARITSGWFWGTNKSTPKTLEALKEMYLHSVGHNSVLLLNVPLNNNGTLDTAIKNRVIDWGKNVQESFHDNNILTSDGVTVSASEVRNNDIKFKPSNIADEDDSTYWAAQDGTKTASVYIDFGKKVIFDAVTLEEDIRFGQRIESYTVSYKDTDGDWIEFASGTTVGGKRVILEKPVKATEMRVTFTGMTAADGTVASPVISHVGVYKATSDFSVGSSAPDGIEEYDSADTSVFSADGWKTVAENGCIGGSYLEGSANDTITITFNGTYAWIVGEKNTDETVLSVAIDGGTAQTVSVVGDSTEQIAILYETPTLGTGKHTMTVKVLSGTAKIDGLYVLNNGGVGLLDFEQSSYTVDEDMYFNVKVVRKGGTTGAIKAIVQDNPGSAVQSSYYTTEGIVIEFAEGETEKTITLRTKRYTEETGTLAFFLEIVSATDEAIVIGFNSPAAVNIIDAESYSGGYLTSMHINSVPDKIVYRVGDTLDLTGLAVSGVYASGDTRKMYPDQYKVDREVLNCVGVVPVTVSSLYDGRSARFTVMVYPVGDANQNGRIDIVDLVSIKKGTAVAGDLDRDGAVNSIDLSILRRHLLGTLVIAKSDSGAMTDIIKDVEWTSGEITNTGAVSATDKAKHAFSEPISANYIIFENPDNGKWNDTNWVNIREYDATGAYVEDSTILIDKDSVIVTKPKHTYRIMIRSCNKSDKMTSADLLTAYRCSIIATEKLDASLYNTYNIINRNDASNTLPDTLDSNDVAVTQSLTMQYDDYCTLNAKEISVASANGYISLDGNTIHAEKVTVSPVYITVDGILTFVTVNKAKVNLILIDGESNAKGTSGQLDGISPITPDSGKGYIYLNGSLTDMKTYVEKTIAATTNSASIGFYPALAAEWYALTGEKTVVINKGYDSAPIHFWAEKGYTNNAVADIRSAISAINNSGNFEIVSAGYYWLQGESNMILEANTNGQQNCEVYTAPADYSRAYLDIHNAYINALETSGVNAFAGILTVRSRDCTNALNAVSEYAGARAAQQYLANNYSDIYMASVLTDSWEQSSSKAYTYTSESGKKVSVAAVSELFADDSIHYSQNGYNVMGMDAADGIYTAVNGATVTDFTLVGENSVTKYNEGTQINAAVNMRRTDTQNAFETNAAQLVAIPNRRGYSAGMTVTVKNSAGKVIDGIIENNGYIPDVTKITETLMLTVTVNGVSKSYSLVYRNGELDVINNVTWQFGSIESNGTLTPKYTSSWHKCYSDALHLDHTVISSTTWSSYPNWTQIKVYDLNGNFIGEQNITANTVFVARNDRTYRFYVANRTSANKGTIEWILKDFADMSIKDMTEAQAAHIAPYTVVESI